MEHGRQARKMKWKDVGSRKDRRSLGHNDNAGCYSARVKIKWVNVGI